MGGGYERTAAAAARLLGRYGYAHLRKRVRLATWTHKAVYAVLQKNPGQALTRIRLGCRTAKAWRDALSRNSSAIKGGQITETRQVWFMGAWHDAG